jgi:hypothetical protein
MKKAERRKLKEKGGNPQSLLKAIRKYKEGSFTYNSNEDSLGRKIEN